MRKALVVAVAVVALALFAPYAQAQWNVSTSPGQPYATDAMAGFATSGDQMNGMQVTAQFADGSSNTATWATTGPGAGAANGTGWSLAESGDTFGGNWILANQRSSNLTMLTIFAAPGNTTFDIVPSPEDTPGSASGLPFTYVSGPAIGNALYSDELIVGGTFYGDEYVQLQLSIRDGLTATANPLVFQADTDNASANSIIHPAPEPMSLLLLSTGLLGIAGFGWRRNR